MRSFPIILRQLNIGMIKTAGHGKKAEKINNSSVGAVVAGLEELQKFVENLQ